jgi:hypothetical protein
MKLIEIEIDGGYRLIADLQQCVIIPTVNNKCLVLKGERNFTPNESYDSLRQRLMEAGMLVGLPPAQDIEPYLRLTHEEMLCKLLCRIHRDGGQYIHDHGIEQACVDAEAKIDEWIARADGRRNEMTDKIKAGLRERLDAYKEMFE